MLEWATTGGTRSGRERDILELGPGPTNRTTRLLRERFGRVIGLDVDPEAAGNVDLAAFYQYKGGPWPTPDGEFDAIVADFVFEHVEDPVSAFSESLRSLRPNGVLIIRTPNLWHYVTLVSAVTPHWFHNLTAGRMRKYEAEAHEVYPTHYRANTARAIRRIARQSGLTVENITRVEKEPAYGMASRFLFYPFMAYERIVNATPALAFARSTLFATLRKRSR